MPIEDQLGIERRRCSNGFMIGCRAELGPQFGHPTPADCYLIPQVVSARRLGVDLAPYPTVGKN